MPLPHLLFLCGSPHIILHLGGYCINEPLFSKADYTHSITPFFPFFRPYFCALFSRCGTWAVHYFSQYWKTFIHSFIHEGFRDNWSQDYDWWMCFRMLYSGPCASSLAWHPVSCLLCFKQLGSEMDPMNTITQHTLLTKTVWVQETKVQNCVSAGVQVR